MSKANPKKPAVISLSATIVPAFENNDETPVKHSKKARAKARKVAAQLAGVKMTRGLPYSLAVGRSLTPYQMKDILDGESRARRTMDVRARAIDTSARTVELAFSSEYAGGERWFGIEVLDHSPGAMKLDRLRDGGAVLVNHDDSDQVGVVQSVSVGADRVARAVVRFGTGPRASEIFQDVADGIRKHVSVGYVIHEMELERDGDGESPDVYRVTSWEPYEISLVPVPFDPTVGVGRSLNPTIKTGENIPNMPTIATPSLRSIGLAPLFGIVSRAQEYLVLNPNGDGPSRLWPTPPAAAFGFQLSDADMQSLRENSRVIRAGAHVIPIDDAKPVPTDSGVMAWYSRPARFEVVTAAAFSALADGDEVATSAPPLARADIGDWGDAPTHSVSFTLTRADRRSRTDAENEFIVLRALALGLAETCDDVLLSAVNASAPSVFTLAKASTRGLQFDELRALCGSAAQGAAIGADGVLRVLGIAAEQTRVSANSIIGAFDRAAIAIDRDIRGTIKRTSKNGDMEITVHVSIKPLLPTPDFWIGA